MPAYEYDYSKTALGMYPEVSLRSLLSRDNVEAPSICSVVEAMFTARRKNVLTK